MASRRRASSVIDQPGSDSVTARHGQYDFVCRSKDASVLVSLGYYYLIDVHRPKKPAFLLGESGDGEDSQSFPIDEKLIKPELPADSMQQTPGQRWQGPLTCRTAWQKPRTVRQHKNKRRLKELEKEYGENERRRSPSTCSSITLVPLSYDERPVDCEGLRRENHSESSRLRSSSSTLSISTAFDASGLRTKPKRSRFHLPSLLFSWARKRKPRLTNAVSDIDLRHQSSSDQCDSANSMHKAKSQVDICTLGPLSNADRVTAFGKVGPKFSTATEEFRREFVRGWWSAKWGRGENEKEVSIDDTVRQESECKRVDSGYDSPEIAAGSEPDNGYGRGEPNSDQVRSYEYFNSSKAVVFNRYFGEEYGIGEEDKPELAKERDDKDRKELEEFRQSDEAISDRIDDPSTRSPPPQKVKETNLPTRSPKALLPAVDAPIVVAIDFGTSYSGYAFAFRGSEEIYMMRRLNTNDPSAVSPKCPTCILLYPDGRFHSFGWEALDAYRDLEPELAGRYLFFQSCKMMLYGEKPLHRGTNAAALNGAERPALEIVAHCLRYLRRHALAELSEVTGSLIEQLHIQWVLTAPSIWNEAAKEFMRMAAYEAGLADPSRRHQLTIALEGEAAALCCLSLKENEIMPPLISSKAFFSLPSSMKRKPGRNYRRESDSVNLGRGTVYAVVDCGAGKVDIVLHRVEDNGRIAELYRANGGPNGSSAVDGAFESLLCELFTAEFMARFRSHCPAAYVDLVSWFESRKRSARPHHTNPFNVALPFAFMEFYKKQFGHRVECAVKRCARKQHVTWNPQGMLRLSSDLMSSLFTPTLVAITTLIQEAIDAVQPANVSYLFLVGGFSESPVLQNEIRSAFGNRMKVVTPNQTSTAVLQGAVKFGLHPERISVRRSTYTYGISVLHPFDPLRHPLLKKVSKSGRHWCRDVFEKLVTANEPVGRDQDTVRHYRPASLDQKDIYVQIYCTRSPDPIFISDSGVRRCAVLKVDLPVCGDQENEAIRDKEIKVIMKFGGAELIVQAVDAHSGEQVNACIDFLNPP